MKLMHSPPQSVNDGSNVDGKIADPSEPESGEVIDSNRGLDSCLNEQYDGHDGLVEQRVSVQMVEKQEGSALSEAWEQTSACTWTKCCRIL